MILKRYLNLTSAALLEIIEEAKNAELCRDFEGFQTALEPIWEDIEKDPDFDRYDAPVKAELLRLSGTLLTSSGRARNKRNYQERGKDLLTNSIEIFEDLGLNEKVAEARVILALCYWNTGEVIECKAILDHAQAEFENDRRHPVFLQICINRMKVLVWEKEYEEARSLVNNIAADMEYCPDMRLRVMYHNEAGIINWRLKQFDDSVFHYKKAIYFAEHINNQRGVAMHLNNLANTYRDMRLFESSHQHIDASIKIYEKIGDRGWLPHVYDTKAQLYFDEEKFFDSLYVIDKSIEIFLKGEDSSGLIEAYWTKTRTLLRLNKKEEALVIFNDLCRIARERVGEVAVAKYVKEFAKLIYVPGTIPFKTDVSSFKRELLRQALVEIGGNVTLVAEKLQITHQSLSQILREQFPELREEFGLTKRSKRSDAHKKDEPEKPDRNVKLTNTVSIVPASIESGREESQQEAQNKLIAPVTLKQDINIEGLDSGSGDIHVFFAPGYKLSPFGITADAVIAVEVKPYKNGKPMLINYKKSSLYDCGYTDSDDFSGLYFLNGDSTGSVPFSPSDIYVIGEIIAYCPVEELTDFNIRFRKIPSTV